MFFLVNIGRDQGNKYTKFMDRMTRTDTGKHDFARVKLDSRELERKERMRASVSFDEFKQFEWRLPVLPFTSCGVDRVGREGLFALIVVLI